MREKILIGIICFLLGAGVGFYSSTKYLENKAKALVTDTAEGVIEKVKDLATEENKQKAIDFFQQFREDGDLAE